MPRAPEPIPHGSAEQGEATAKLSGADSGSFGHRNGHTATSQLATYGLLGRLFDDALIEAGQRAPEKAQLQFTGTQWRLYGGEDYPEPLEVSVPKAYVIAATATDIDEQDVLDHTRKACGELRLTAKGQRGAEQRKTEATWERLRDELAEARKVKLARLEVEAA